MHAFVGADPTMTLSHPLSQPFERRMRAFGTHLPMAVEGEVESLHQCRVATRRLREVLPLCAAEVSPVTAGRARRRLRRVGRALGPVREADVALELVDRLSRQGVVPEAAGGHLRRHLVDERDEGREQMIDRLRSVNTRKLERDLADIARLLGMRQQTDGWAYTLATRMGSRAQRLREAIGMAGPLYIADRVHAVRIAAKKLRYSLEFAVETREARVKGAVRQIKDVQETLGRLHDQDVLASLVRDLTSPHADQPWNGDLEDVRQWLERECRELHGRYVAKQMLLLEICDAATRAAEHVRTERGGGILGEQRVPPAGRVLKMRLDDSRTSDQAARGEG